MRRPNVHSAHLGFGGGWGGRVFFYISLQEESLVSTEIRQNLSSEVSREPFYNFPYATLTAREGSGQDREEEYAEEDRDGKNLFLKKHLQRREI